MSRRATATATPSDGDLVLREPREADLAALARACADPDLAAWVHPPAPDAGEAARRLLERLSTGRRDGSLAPFLVVAADGGELLGLVALMHEGDPEVAEVAYWVAPAARGRGVATRALRLASRFGLEEAGLARLWLEIEPGNAASHRVAERAGYRREGVLRSHCRDRRSGERHDCVVYSLLPGDEPP